MSVPVFWLSRHPGIDSFGPWDTGIIQALFDGELWPHPWIFEEHRNVSWIEPGDTAVVVLPARHHAGDGDVAWLNAELRKLRAAVLILVGDEEAVFPWREIIQDNVKFWVMIPDPVKHSDMRNWAFFFGDGWKRDTPGLLRGELPEKRTAWSFSGQVVDNARRKAAVAGLQLAERRVKGELMQTEGFTQGMARELFLKQLARTKVAPCPAGPMTPDTFRLYEALEAGCFPIADARSAAGVTNYWEMVYGSTPFPILDDWGTVGGHIEQAVKAWPAVANRASAWWIARKREMEHRLTTDLLAIGTKPDFPKAFDQLTTVFITCSPIPSHPSIALLEETLESAWNSMGRDTTAIVAFDGVRPEQDKLRQQYEEAIQLVCWKAQHGSWAGRVLPIVSDIHRHQARLTKYTLPWVTTPTILFMEHDTPFSDEPIDWESCLELVAYGGLDVLRFHHEAQIHPEHAHLMEDEVTRTMLDVPLRRTRQWSQRPHLARTDYYRRMLDHPVFSKPNNGFIEDVWHGQVQNFGDWTANKVAIYHPEGSIRRSLHTDGRAGGPKFDDRNLP